MKKSVLILFSMLLLLTACGSGGTETTRGKNTPEYVFRFAHEESPDSVQNTYAEEFKKIIEEKSDGNIKIEIYPVGQLGNATTQAELLQIGAIDFAIISPGNIGTIVPESQVLLLHFLFSDDMEINKQIMNNSEALYGPLAEKFAEKKIKVLSYWTEGFNHWTTQSKIEQPEDFSGVKFRTMPSPLIVSSYEQYGANPTPVPYEQVYSGLQLNMIEGQTNPMFAIEQMKFYEVQKYLTLSKHSLYTTTTAVNPDLYEKVPEEVRQMIDETINEMKEKAFAIQEETNQQALEQIKKNSNIEITELSDEQRQAFRDASEPVRQQYIDQVGGAAEEIVKKLEEEIEEAEKNSN
ncbi:DctP family TRAP transporter solute-binding subunit [Sediminibacillus halophilus]|uniref:Tripartite ATP-independent transporter solute receptor, DctP family n=1 Tax=Sediminibacillus halophilus TaxID=482461 RepID=A0A1G9N037_9BACI|nr:DctP family TRAP transporter solute-binding subunit [Sediminibacillus halophilus]SDL79839.1 tripartite ATP-independent transporter solute receptor, DctP family [Sediminibacillus halophilus]